MYGFKAISDCINDWWLSTESNVKNNIQQYEKVNLNLININEEKVDVVVHKKRKEKKVVKEEIELKKNIDDVLASSKRQLINGEIFRSARTSHVRDTYTAAVQDDYEYWRSCGESDTSGKLFLIDYSSKNNNSNNNNSNSNNDNNSNDKKKCNTSDNNEKNTNNNEVDHDINITNSDIRSGVLFRNTSSKTIHIFFDDNIERQRLHIVDVRDIKTSIPIPFKNVNNVFIKRVEPYFAITDENYYIDEAIHLINAQIQ